MLMSTFLHVLLSDEHIVLNLLPADEHAGKTSSFRSCATQAFRKDI